MVGKVSEFFAPHKVSPQTVVEKSITPTIEPKVTSVLGAKNYEQAQVIKVVDGDTIHVLLDNKEETVRLIGVDTPETVDPKKTVQCFGKEASDFTKSKLDGKKVFVQEDPTQTNRDKYNRLLRYVFLADGTNFNKSLVLEGYAHEYTYDVPYKYQTEFKQAQQEAMANNRGLWKLCYTK